MKNKLFIALAMLLLETSSSRAANYIASTATASAKVASSDYTIYSGSGRIVFNENGVANETNVGYECLTNKCRYGPALTYVYVVKASSDVVFYTSATNFNESNSVPRGANSNEAAKAYQARFGNQISFTDTFYGNNEDKPPYKLLLGVGICMVSKLPGGSQLGLFDKNSCSILKPSVSCTSPSELVLDHGNLQLGRVNGNKKTGIINVNCSGALSAKLLLLPDTINLAPGLTSKITVNGSSAEKTIPLSSGVNNLSVESTLVDSGAKAGRFEGSTTLVISYQ